MVTMDFICKTGLTENSVTFAGITGWKPISIKSGNTTPKPILSCFPFILHEICKNKFGCKNYIKLADIASLIFDMWS